MARKQFMQGVFRPLHPEKYKGTLPIQLRSSYEFKFCRWADHNPNVVSWGSETIIIPYFDPVKGKVRRYFVDNNITLRTPTGDKKFLIEIKPLIQTIPPKIPKKASKSYPIKQMEYATNKAKWDAANQWANKNNYTFCLLTEKELGIK